MVSLREALCMIGEGHIDVGKPSFRNIDIYREDAFVDTPFHLYHTKCAHRGALAPNDVANGMRLDLYQITCTLDAQEVRYQEILDVCHHKVVHRRTHIRIPLLCQRGVSLLDLITIARYIVVVQHRVEQVTLVVVYQYRKEIPIAHIACCQTRSVGFDIVDQMLEHSLIVVLRN